MFTIFFPARYTKTDGTVSCADSSRNFLIRREKAGSCAYAPEMTLLKPKICALISAKLVNSLEQRGKFATSLAKAAEKF